MKTLAKPDCSCWSGTEVYLACVFILFGYERFVSHASSLCSGQRRICCLIQLFMLKYLGSQFDEEPKYTAYVALFEPLCGPGPQRPILLEDKARVGQKRGRDSAEDEMLEIVRLPRPLLGGGSLATDGGALTKLTGTLHNAHWLV